jgi:hypothetical protein
MISLDLWGKIESNFVLIEFGNKIRLILCNGGSANKRVLQNDNSLDAGIDFISFNPGFPSDFKNNRRLVLKCRLVHFNRFYILNFIPIQKVPMPRRLIIRIFANLGFLCILDQKVIALVLGLCLDKFVNEVVDFGMGGVEFLFGLPCGLLDGSIEPMDEEEFVALLLLDVEDFGWGVGFF